MWGSFAWRDSLSQKTEAGGVPWMSRGPGRNHGQSVRGGALPCTTGTLDK